MVAMLRDQRGVALPMALLSLGLLLPLMLALASLSTHEPLIAGNLLQASQGRTLADSGLQYALWALSAPGGLPSPLPA
jgi:Tfp pilus assembly protein PilX